MLPVGDVKMLFRFIEGERGLVRELEDETRRKLERGTRREECWAGFMGCVEAPGLARPADSFCSGFVSLVVVVMVMVMQC